MEEYYFLFAIGALWSIFAVVQDFKTREISNWLNFSLVAIGLAYRAFYSAFSSDWGIFLYGILGFCIFYGMAYLFYYARVFAGGDAKLLMGFGAILPYGNFNELLLVGGIFIFSLLLAGALWSLIYSAWIVRNNYSRFKKEFKKLIFGVRYLILGIFLGSVGLALISGFYLFLVLVLMPLVFVYVKALEKCMINLISYKDLREGDWLENDVRVGKRVIKKSVHGLSLEEIRILQRARKSVLIRDGVPFAIAFLLALVMVFFYLA